MLDNCRMTSSLSPTTPSHILSDVVYGMWEQDGGLSTMGTKIETSDILEFMDSGLPSPTTMTPTSGSLALNHNTSMRDAHFQSQYLTPLPSLSGETYGPPDSQMLENYHSLASIDSSFQKFSDVCSPPYSENYENYIPDLTAPSHLMQNQGLSHGSGHQHHDPGDQGDLSHSNHLMHNHSMTGTHEPIFNPHHQYSYHPDYMCEDFGCDPSDYFLLRKGESPTTSDSISYRDIDSEVDSKSSGESLETLKNRLELRASSPPKRRVGRPPKKDKKLKRSEKRTGRLWEFIRDLLKNPDYCPSLVRWENPDEGHFRFVNSEKVAQLWGQIKGNPRMTYEKLSRAMRYYYKSHVFEPVLGRRLVYKFGCNAVNWKPVNPNFVVQKLYS